MKAADLDRPPKQWTSTPPESIPASIKILAAGIQDSILEDSLHVNK